MSLYQTTREMMRHANGRLPTRRKVANNTYLEMLADDSVAVRLHNTDIVVIFPDDVLVLNSGGWQTVTTKDRMNRFAGPFTVRSIRTRRGPGGSAWHVFADGVDQGPFEDGMTLDARDDRTEPLDGEPAASGPAFWAPGHNHPERDDLVADCGACHDSDCNCRECVDRRGGDYAGQDRESYSDTGLDTDQESLLHGWLSRNGYANVEAWLEDSGYIRNPDGDWEDEDGWVHHEPAVTAWWAYEAEMSELLCANDCGRPATEVADGPGEDGQSYCANCT